MSQLLAAPPCLGLSRSAPPVVWWNGRRHLQCGVPGCGCLSLHGKHSARRHPHGQRPAAVASPIGTAARGRRVRGGSTGPSCSRASYVHFNIQATAVSDPTNLRNARNAILEELPRIVNTMALLWNVLRKEETQKRPVDLLGATKGSSSVYFKTTKVSSLRLT